MSSTSTLLTRKLHDVFGESDPRRRRAAIDEIFTEDCVFYDPSRRVYRGRDEIDRVGYDAAIAALRMGLSGVRWHSFGEFDWSVLERTPSVA